MHGTVIETIKCPLEGAETLVVRDGMIGSPLGARGTTRILGNHLAIDLIVTIPHVGGIIEMTSMPEGAQILETCFIETLTVDD